MHNIKVTLPIQYNTIIINFSRIIKSDTCLSISLQLYHVIPYL